MEQRISIITLGVSNLKKSKAFYDKIGWSQSSKQGEEEIIAYDLHSMTLCLYPWDKLAEDIGIESNDNKAGPLTIAHNVSSENEVDKVLQEAANAGAKIIKPAQKVFWGGYSGYFSDPDGHIWEVAHNPFAKMGPKGEFQWNGIE